jgi:hypothetical protein
MSTLINKNSLAETVDILNAMFFEGTEISEPEREQVGIWIAARQGLKGAYANMFAPTGEDYQTPLRLFTGEKVTTGAGTGHIIGEEACRVMLKLNLKNPESLAALARATAGMMDAIVKERDFNKYNPGWFCCGTCTPTLWRHLSAGGLDNTEARYTAGLKALKSMRDGNGKWRRFKFHWTISALIEMDLPEAAEELRYVSKTLERIAKRKSKPDKFSLRRKRIAELALERI